MIIDDATQEDVNRLNAICGLPRVGRNARTGRLANVPRDYAARVAAGERLPGVTAYYAEPEIAPSGTDRDGLPIMSATGRTIIRVSDADAARLEAFDAASTRAKVRAPEQLRRSRS